ncbi:hypothetical protein [Bacillus sp. C30]|uniref:hypothetical protein n=1 Tax=Bacillus sp. C30 TaxID=1387733 RepID=UPI00349F10E8
MTKKKMDMFKIACSFGVWGYVFFLGAMLTHLYYAGDLLLATCIYGFIGSVLLTIQYHMLRNLPFKERILEIAIVLIIQAYTIFPEHQNMHVVTLVFVIAVVTCVLINQKKVRKVYG